MVAPFARRSMAISWDCLLPSRLRGAAFGSRDFGLLRPRIRLSFDVVVFAIAFRISASSHRIDAQRVEGGLRSDERRAASLLVMPPDGVVALGADLLDQALVEEALEHVAGGVALEFGGDREDAAIGTLAGGGKNDELGVGQLRHGFAP